MDYWERRLRKERRRRKLFIAGVLLLFWVSLFLSFFVIKVNIDFREEYLSKLNEPLSDEDGCANLEFKEAVNCVNKEVGSFYNYNMSNSRLYWPSGKISDDEWERIKTEGGVCWHYAKYYIERMEELGYSGASERIYLNNAAADHAIAILDNNFDEYCVVDQTRIIGCYTLKSTPIGEIDNG